MRSSAEPLLRPAAPHDLDAVIALCVRDSLAGVYGPMIAAHPEAFRKTLARVIETAFYPVPGPDCVVATRAFLFIAESHNVLLGFLLAVVNPERTTPAVVDIEALMLSVSAHAQRSGVSQRLISHLRAHIGSLGRPARLSARCLSADTTGAIAQTLSRAGLSVESVQPNGVTLFAGPC